MFSLARRFVTSRSFYSPTIGFLQQQQSRLRFADKQTSSKPNIPKNDDDDSQLDKLKRALAEFEKEYRKSLMEEKKPDSNNNSSSDNEKRKANGGAGKDGSDKDSSDGPPKLSWRTIALVTGASIGLFVYSMMKDIITDQRQISFHQFLTEYLPKAKLIVINPKTLVAVAYDEFRNVQCEFTFPSAAALDAALLEAAGGDVRKTPNVIVRSDDLTSQLLINLLPSVLIVGALLYSARLMGGTARKIFATGTTNSRVAPEHVTVRFSDVAGLDEAKREITEFVEFLRRPAKFRRLGARIPRGALLVGPPGTGKTLLAKATAGEAQVPFFSMAGSDFTEMFVGVGPARVRDLFAQARQAAPCIVFLDEIDAVGRARSSGRVTNDERESTLNQLLVELDGFDVHSGIVVLAGTNRPDVLDKALLRPGRFDRIVTIDLPDIRGRKQIFDIHLKRITVPANSDRNALAETLAALSPGFSGADIANVCNEAALIAARSRASSVEMTHFEQAIERVVAGLAKQHRVLSEAERRIVAVHESGHAIVGYFLRHCDPLLKVSIVPRGAGALGYAMYQPTERAVTSAPEMADRMSMTLAGRAAEELVFGRISTGAADDLDKVTKLAYYQVCSGMNEKVGPLAFQMPDPGDMFATRQYSEHTAQQIDDEVRRLVAHAYDRARELLRSKRDLVDRLSARLLHAEQLVFADLQEILGPRPFTERRLYSEIVADDARRNSPHSTNTDATTTTTTSSSSSSSSDPTTES